jgi:hypothetical protein
MSPLRGLLTKSVMAHRDASLRRTDWLAIGGIADMRGALRTVRCDAIDPKRSSVWSKCRTAASPLILGNPLC